MAIEMQIGDLTMLAVRDGEWTMRAGFFGDPEAHQQLADVNGEVRLPIGCFVIPGDEPLLIDAGLGPDLESERLHGGALLDELAALGIVADDVLHLALSHLHPDHMGWLATERGGVTFPNAQVYVNERDWQHFLVEGHDPRPSPWLHAALFDLAESGRVTLHDAEAQIASGVTALPAPGHTPGHTVYVIHDHGDRALIFGDAIYCPQQLTEVDWEAASDLDPALARRTRERLWREVEDHGAQSVGPHFPGLQAGRVFGARWVPA